MGGVETHCEELFPRMVERGYDVMLIRRSNYVMDDLYISNHLLLHIAR